MIASTPRIEIVNKKEKRNSLSVTGLHLLSRSRLAYRHILIMLPFSDKFGLQRGVYQVKIGIKGTKPRPSVLRVSTADERGKTSRKQAVGSLFPFEEIQYDNTDNHDSSVTSRVQASYPQCAALPSFSFTHWLVLYVLALKRKDYATPQARVYFLFSVWRIGGLTARRQELRGYRQAVRSARLYPAISLVTGSKQSRLGEGTSFNYKINPPPSSSARLFVATLSYN